MCQGCSDGFDVVFSVMCQGCGGDFDVLRMW